MNSNTEISKARTPVFSTTRADAEDLKRLTLALPCARLDNKYMRTLWDEIARGAPRLPQSLSLVEPETSQKGGQILTCSSLTPYRATDVYLFDRFSYLLITRCTFERLHIGNGITPYFFPFKLTLVMYYRQLQSWTRVWTEVLQSSPTPRRCSRGMRKLSLPFNTAAPTNHLNMQASSHGHTDPSPTPKLPI